MSICAIFMFTYTQACDICGGASSSFSMGLLPSSKHHFIGCRTSFKSFESRDLHSLSGRVSSQEFFTTNELFGRYKLSKKFQVLAFVPYVYNQRKDSVETWVIHGLGDVSLVSNYVFIDNSDSVKKQLKQAGTVGFGVKLPTGQYFKLGFDELNMLPGTGSFDFIFNSNYSIQYKAFGLQSETSFTIKTANKYLYQFGNALSNTEVFFYRWEVNENLKILPQIGLNINHNWKDRKNGFLSEDTFNGGSIFNAQFNLGIMYKKWGITAQVFAPIKQNLNEGYVTQKSSFRVSMNYFITKK